MTESYLWDPKARPVDPFVQRLERALVSKRYAPSNRWSVLKKVRAVAIAVVAAGAAAAILVTAYGGASEPHGDGTIVSPSKNAGEIASEREPKPIDPASAGEASVGHDEANVGH